jgi:TRAP-type C4-dicarboxylate transport system permease small subunit
MGFWQSLAILLVGGGIIYLLFNNYRQYKKHNTTKATATMWMSALLPIGFVVIFVLFLILMLRG